MATKYFKLSNPSVSLNAPNVRNKLKMTYAPVIPWSKSAHQIISENVHSAMSHLVFNCHGYATRESFATPHLSIGTVIHTGNVSCFDPLTSYPTLKVIWMAACNIASSAQGIEFCKEVARHARAYVVASITACPDLPCPAGCILDPGPYSPYIVDPRGTPVGQQSFRAMGNQLGFSPA